MRLSLVCWESGGRKTGVERPDIEILNASVTVNVMEGSPLCENYGQPARAVLQAAVPACEALVVGIGQSDKVAQMLVSELRPRSR